jgi:hypothetical protein
MHRASNAFSVLQATAATVGIAILLWSIGLPSFRFAEAAAVTSYSDTLSDSAPGVDANHTITFSTPTGVTNGADIVITFDSAFTPTGVDHTDIDMATTSGEFSLAATCGGAEDASASFSGDVLTITLCPGDGGLIASGGTTTIEIGTHATNQTAGDQQINNPGTTGSYPIGLTAGASDSGETRVAIVNSVLVSASVDTLFTFTVAGTTGGTTVNDENTTGSTTATEIPFGVLQSGVASTAAQELTVVTNAKNGFVVTVATDQQLLSSNGADIDGFANGAFTASPIAWTSPSASPGLEETYGHWGITTDDGTLTQSLTDPFDVAGSSGNRYVSASTTPVEIFRNDGPTDGTGNGEGTAIVGYKVQISSLQEAAEDYQATLTYVATPVF